MGAQTMQIIAKRFAQVFAALNVLIVLAGVFLGLIAKSDWVDIYVIMVSLLSIAYSVLALLIITRDPGHIIGWLFLIEGFLSLWVGFQAFLLVFNLSEQFYQVVNWFGGLIFIPIAVIPITLVLQFFPDGHLPSKRWWPVTAGSIIGMLGLTVFFAFSPWQWQGSSVNPIQKSFVIEGQDELFNSIYQVSQAILIISLVGTLAMVIVRFWKAQRIQREQMKWLVYTVVLGIPILLITSNTSINYFLLFLLPVIMAISITIAVLRYRLFDIDLIIRRTVQYALLTGLLALVYFGSVVLLQTLFETLTGEQSPVVTVISTLVIAALFTPLRIRIQDFIDRRFYRRKYDAERALAQFAETARDEVDLDVLTHALLGMVDETVQPENKSLWLISQTSEES